MSKISIHKEREKIEKIILECKFLGLGSVEIQKQLLSKLGLKVSRPSIDKHYKENMNGAFLTEQIARAKKSAIMSVSNGTSEQEIQAPSFCHESAKEAIKHIEEYQFYDERFGENGISDNLKEVYANTIGLIKGNFIAHTQGKERLKPEYLKYLAQLRDLVKMSVRSY